MMEAITQFTPDVLSYGPASGMPACRAAFASYHSQWQPLLLQNMLPLLQVVQKLFSLRLPLSVIPG